MNSIIISGECRFADPRHTKFYSIETENSNSTAAPSNLFEATFRRNVSCVTGGPQRFAHARPLCPIARYNFSDWRFLGLVGDTSSRDKTGVVGESLIWMKFDSRCDSVSNGLANVALPDGRSGTCPVKDVMAQYWFRSSIAPRALDTTLETNQGTQNEPVSDVFRRQAPARRRL